MLEAFVRNKTQYSKKSDITRKKKRNEFQLRNKRAKSYEVHLSRGMKFITE